MVVVFSFTAAAVLLIAFFAAYWIPQHYHIKYSDQYNFPSETIWCTINNLGLAGRRRFTKHVEQIGTNHLGLPIWREYSRFGTCSVYEVIEKTACKKLTIHLKDSSYGIKGKWCYELEEKKGKTTVTITEQSEIHQFPARLLVLLAGRDFQIKKQFRALEQALLSSDHMLTSH